MAKFMSLDRLSYYHQKLMALIKSTPQTYISYSRNVTTADIGALLYNITANGTNQLTIPASVFVVGSEFMVCKWNVGAITVKGAPGVYINGVVAGTVTLADQYDVVTLKQITTDNWLMIGKGTVA